MMDWVAAQSRNRRTAVFFGAIRWMAPGVCLGVAFCLAGPNLAAQELLPGSRSGDVRLLNSDLAVFELGEERKDLDCTVTPVKPDLGFDLRFHAGFDVTIPLKDLSGTDNTLSVLFRVTSDTQKDDPVYFSQHFQVPPIQEDASGDAYLEGAFDVGEGHYHVDWLMRDRSEQVCSSFWDSDAVLSPRTRRSTW